MFRKIYILLLILSYNIQIFGQDTLGLPIIKNYLASDYHAHYQNWGAKYTKSGMMIFSNGNGLLTFDGENWDLLKFSDYKFPRSIDITPNGKIYVAGEKLFGQMIVDSLGNLKFKSLSYLLPQEYQESFFIWNLIATDSAIYAMTEQNIFIIKDNKCRVVKSDNYFFKIFRINGKLFACQRRGFKYIDKNKTSNIDTAHSIYTFWEHNNKIFYYTTSNEIFYLDKNLKSTFYTKVDYNFTNIIINSIIIYQEKYLLFYSINKGILQFDLKGNLISELNKRNGLISNSIYNISPDKNNNLWICTNNGLSYVEMNSPIRVIDSRQNIDVSTISSMNFFNNKLFITSGHHFYSIDYKKKNTSTKEIINAEGQTWDGIEIGNELYLSHNTGIIRLLKNGETINYGPSENVWKIIQIPGNFDKFFVGTSNGIYLYKYDGDSLRFENKLKNFEGSSREMLFDSLGNLWVSVEYKGLYKITLNEKFEIEKKILYDEKKGLNCNNSILLFNWRNHLFISVYKTLFEYDYANDSIHVFHPIVDKYDYSGDKVLQLVSIDKNNLFWFEYYDNNLNFNVFTIKEINNEYKEVLPVTRRLLNFSLTGSIIYGKTHNLIATSNGLVILNTSEANKISNSNFQTLIRKVSFSKTDSVIFHGFSYTSSPENINTFQSKDEELTIDYKNNDIEFQFSAPFYTEPEKTLYRYKLLNYHTEWSQWNYDSKKGYTNLAPGKYVFIAEAKNIYNQISEPVYFNFQIKYPWYRTFYAYSVYSALLILIVSLIVKFFTLRLKRKNEQLEEIVKERTSELVQKNVELEQQTEEIITQAEELQIVNQELTKFSTAVQETDNAIILTDKDANFTWINSAFTKIFGYTFDDLINEVSHNLISIKTDLNTKNKINKCLTEKITVEYELKLKNKAKEDIWIHTTLTPILDDNNEIDALIAIDSDITEIKKAEVQIRDQRDQIKASIIYAKTIQDSILPSKKLISKLFDNFIIFKAKDIVSGDFYWISNIFKQKSNGKLTRVIDDDISFKPGYTTFIIVVDCTGHGVPAAFMSLIGNHLLGEIINEERYDDPKTILEILDYKLGKVLKRSKKKNYDGMVISICKLDRIMINDKEKTKVTFAGAKQHITYYKKDTNKFEKIRGVARQIGFVINDSIKFENHELLLEPDDFLFLYSDGLKDLNNKERISFGYKKIIDVLKHNITKDVDVIGQKLTQRMELWLSEENQRDDITFIGLKM